MSKPYFIQFIIVEEGEKQKVISPQDRKGEKMGKSRKQLYAELEALKDELPKRETIASLLEAEGFQLAIEEYKQKFKEVIDAEDKKEISSCKKTMDLLIDFQGFLNKQQERAQKIPELISEIEWDLSQRNLFE